MSLQGEILPSVSIPVRSYPVEKSYPDIRKDVMGKDCFEAKDTSCRIDIVDSQIFQKVLTSINEQLQLNTAYQISINYLYTLSIDAKFAAMSFSDAREADAHHRDIARRKRVICAGTFGNTVNAGKYLFLISNMSGSYCPESEASLANTILLMISLGLTKIIHPSKIHVEFHTTIDGKYTIVDLTKKYQPWFQKLTPDHARAMYLNGAADKAGDPKFNVEATIPTKCAANFHENEDSKAEMLQAVLIEEEYWYSEFFGPPGIWQEKTRAELGCVLSTMDAKNEMIVGADRKMITKADFLANVPKSVAGSLFRWLLLPLDGSHKKDVSEPRLLELPVRHPSIPHSRL